MRVLGIDDFSLRTGRDYATLLVDMETGEPVDVLPDREAATVREWLSAHPEVEVICRDRAGAYAAGGRGRRPARGPGRGPVASVAQPVRARPRGRRPPPGVPGAGPAAPAQASSPGRAGSRTGRAERTGATGACPPGLEAVIRERHAAVHELRAAGKTLPEAAAALGLSRQLTGRFWRAASADALLKVRGASALDPWKPYLRRRWDAGTTTIAVLHREITALGYAGSEPTTYAWLALLKLAAPPKPPAPPAKRQVTGWMLTDPARLDGDQQAQLTAILRPLPRTATPWPGTSPHSPRCSPAAPATGLDGWLAAAGPAPASPNSPPSPTASAATTRPSATP